MAWSQLWTLSQYFTLLASERARTLAFDIETATLTKTLNNSKITNFTVSSNKALGAVAHSARVVFKATRSQRARSNRWTVTSLTLNTRFILIDK